VPTVSEELIKALLDNIAEEKAYLAAILNVLGGEGDDLMIQYPDSTDKMILAAGASFSKEINIRRKLKYVSMSAPDDLLITLENDNQVIFFSQDEIGALEMMKGITINNLKISVTNSGLIPQKWSLRMIFA
jgi:hypothetical protein